MLVKMDVLEFLERTNKGNMRCNINLKVKERLRKCAEDLELRREKLFCVLQSENLRLDGELMLLVEARAEEAERQRFQWISLERLKREEAEMQLLKLKKEQREIENCEEMRELQSKQILRETKKAQLFQIEERKAIRHKEQQIEMMWSKAWRRLGEVKAEQEEYEMKLRKAIANLTQAKNREKEEEKRKQIMDESMVQQRQYALEHKHAAAYDALSQKEMLQKTQYKKLQQQQLLKAQMAGNEKLRFLAQQAKRLEDMDYLLREQKQIVRERREQDCKEVSNRVWQKTYLEHTQKERLANLERDKAYADSYLGTGCILQQTVKNPYGNTVR